MELRSIGALIGTLVLLTVTTPSVQLLGISFEDDACCDKSNCSLGVESCELVRCDCPSAGAYCEETDTCGPSCTLNQLKVGSCCDFIPEQFHSDELIHVLHIERYTNVISPSSDETVTAVSVWTQLNTTVEKWKLLRLHLLNMSNVSGVHIPTVVAVSDSLALSLIEVISDFEEALYQINETVPQATSLKEGLDGLQRIGECWRELTCGDRTNMECQCHLCEKTTDTVLSDKISQNMTIPTGYYITEVGNHFAKSIRVSSNLSALHGPVNTVDKWAKGTFGGWAPASSDPGMFMAFHNLARDVCGIVIQGMAASTFRSLEQFKVSVNGVTLQDEKGNDIVYRSGVLLDSKSVHFFPKPVAMSSCLEIEIIQQPLDPTRVGFRAGLIGCSNSTPSAQPESVCNFVEEVRRSVTEGFKELEEEDELNLEENPAQTSVAISKFIKQALADEKVTTDNEFDITITVKVNGADAEVSLVGVKSERLLTEGFSDGIGAGGGGVQPEVAIAIPSSAFQKLADSLSESSVILLTVVVVKVNDNATSVFLKTQSHDIGSPILQFNMFVGNRTHQLSQLNYTVTLKNVTEDAEEPPVCAFFEEEEAEVGNSVEWKTEGCTRVFGDDVMIPKVTCQCNHTTSYAVLLQVQKTDHSKQWKALLSTVTTVGLTISIAALTLALLIYFLLRANISSARFLIHSNLMVALLLLSGVFVSPLLKTKSEALCDIYKYLLMYLIMATFCWMLAEGMHLYRQIITVFESEWKQNWLYFVVGWALPVVFTGCAMGLTMTSTIESHGQESCFFSPEDGSIWIVTGPVLAIILINMLILLRVTLIVVKAVRFQADKESETITQVKAGLRSALLLMPLLGTTYLLAFVTHHSPVLELLYNIVNSLQGFFVALFYCVLNTEVRNAINTYIRRSKDQGTLQGSTTGLKGDLRSKAFFPKNKVVPVEPTQFTFTSSSQSKLSGQSMESPADRAIPVVN